MSVRNPNYQQVHDLYELCSDEDTLRKQGLPEQAKDKEYEEKLQYGLSLTRGAL